MWLVPGGGLELGEDAVTAAKREAWEEAGILGHIARYLGLFEVRRVDNKLSSVCVWGGDSTLG